MKYYLIEVADGDEKIKGKAIYSYETKKEAMANFHSKLGNAMKSELYTSERIAVINDTMAIEISEVYIADNKL